jgi:hypothetical protein
VEIPGPGCRLVSSWRTLGFVLCAVCLGAAPVWGDGHGPAFGYSTTVLGVGDTSIETTLMWRSGVAMIGPQVSYGLRQNLQLSISAPFHLNQGEHPVGLFSATMPGNPEVEGLLAWRFHHKLTGVGTRNESTLYVGGSATTQLVPRADGPPLEREPAIYAAIATGHISRSYYLWVGAGYQHYGHWNSGALDHQSDSALANFVVGWRPSFLAFDYPRPDLRFFLETTADRIGRAWRDTTDIATSAVGGHVHGAPIVLPPPTPSGVIVLPDSGRAGVYSGPTFLCTYRSLAFQTGVQFALWDQRKGTQPAERLRAMIGVSYFFLGGRK